ncbi:MoaF C-terminal domain-containing protein [Paraburkholderia elongata]|uniref:Molybdenum cofactor biosynthesis protein F n=1 Tax=Paraburkholderia elongata TaxID=2675747 RepID=A0A972SJL2_9BURK|nr:MoaF C-terminal domain-containing protein [Paraburkholderia elongata]NPT55825.1 molybdenum cofactor biosynthesis protein F [Paraburkholderia elongata]
MTSQPVFIQVGALADGFAPDSHILPPVDDLTGRTLQLEFADGSAETLTFDSAGVLRKASGQFECRVTSVRDGIYFVDYIGGGDGSRPAATSYVLDVKQGLCTVVVGTLPNESEARTDAFTRVERGLELTGVQVQFRHGRIMQQGAQAGAEAALHHPTRELIGMRNLYTYSATEQYEHVYLNDNFYAWQCLSGVEAGLADVDRCHYIAIAKDLYLFVWREKIIPTLGVVMIDLERKKTDGKIFGYQGNQFDTLSNFPVGALAQVLNVTRHLQ